MDSPAEFGEPDAVILPGSKNTIRDLLWMRQNGLEAKILRYASEGGIVFGICGGYQMLGAEISDPEGVEQKGSGRGMGPVPVRTRFTMEKRRTRIQDISFELRGILKNLCRTSGF